MYLSTRFRSFTRSNLLVVALATLLLPRASRAAAPPPNDDLASAQVIPTDSFSVMGTELGATQENFERAANYADTFGVNLSASVWYSWTPSISGVLTVNSLNTGTNGDQTPVLFFEATGTPTASTYVGGTSPGIVTFTANVTAHQPYFFSVANELAYAHPFILKGTLAPASETPTVTVVVKKPEAVRSTGAVGKLLVELSQAPTTALTIEYMLGGTAVNGTDYAMLSGSVTVPAGVTQAAIKIKPMAGESGTTKVKLTIVQGQGYTVGSVAKGKVQIVD